LKKNATFDGPENRVAAPTPAGAAVRYSERRPEALARAAKRHFPADARSHNPELV
jgi:hypothetical protein